MDTKKFELDFDDKLLSFLLKNKADFYINHELHPIHGMIPYIEIHLEEIRDQDGNIIRPEHKYKL